MTTLHHPSSNHVAPKATFSLPSILAIICVIASFMVGPGAALFLAIGAAVFGVIGVVVALLPGVRGGIISTLSILLGVIGFVIAVVRLVL